MTRAKTMDLQSGPVSWPADATRATPEQFRDPHFAAGWSALYSAPIAPDDEPKLVRQEFAEEADINTLINRYGPLTRMGGADDYGEFDLTQDLTDALEAMRVVRSTYDRLPEHVRQRYSAAEFQRRMETGEEISLAKDTPKEEPEPAPKSDTP